MPPKVKVTKKEIINAALEIVRQQGMDALNARTVAAFLNCSTQPVFSNFATMDDLKLAVVEKADAICGDYIQREIESGQYPPYKASGMAYIRFAKEEKELFRLLYMRNRALEAIPDETDLGNQMAQLVNRNTGLEENEAKLFHLEMWAFVHGIAAMMATDYLDLDWELVSRMLTDAYQGLRKRFGKE